MTPSELREVIGTIPLWFDDDGDPTDIDELPRKDLILDAILDAVIASLGDNEEPKRGDKMLNVYAAQKAAWAAKQDVIELLQSAKSTSKESQ